MEPVKVNIINTLQLLASVDQQDEYDKNVPVANVVHELISQWFDDFFDVEDGHEWLLEYFEKDEVCILMEFHNFYEQRLDKLPDTYAELREHFNWKEVVGKANWALDMLKWRDIEAKYDDD